MSELIITEKPSAAKKIAEALADSKPKKESYRTVPYYTLTHEGKEIIVACAVGHLYTVGEKEKTPWSQYPVFDVEWVPTADVDKNAAFSKKYLNTLKKVCKDADEFTVACDYDIEGEVIGWNIVRYICGKKDAARMKFSTLTKPDLVKAYNEKSKSLDWGQAHAGETRHMLDFFYGINLTRALTGAINKVTSGFKVLSIGRVQGPALKIIVEKEKEIKAFEPVPYWMIQLLGKVKGSDIEAFHKEDKFWERDKADQVMEKVAGAKEGKISKLDKKEFKQAPPVPFDLTSLQIEAYRCIRTKPKHTLDIAQRLYSDGLISYPRTSSQKLPESLGFKKILTDLKKQEVYSELAERILKTPLKPNEGKKTDDAHPAIFPTGLAPKELDGADQKLYDLIVKRFLSVFAEPAVRETTTVNIDVNSEDFVTKGTVTTYAGWHEFYIPYVKLDEAELPVMNEGDVVAIDSINQLDKETTPPKRYTQASIIKALEKQGLGTKATRAHVVETLFHRGYVVGEQNIEATRLGVQTVDVLHKYSPDILDQELTRRFENEMDQIRKREHEEGKVLEGAREVLDKIISTFKEKQQEIGDELKEANEEAIRIATDVGKCPNCDGELTIRRGRFGRFIACNNYPDCKTTYNIPRTGTIRPSEKKCEACNMPMVKCKQPRKGMQEICINPDCPTKTNGEGADQHFPEEGMECPVCKKGKMVLRKSFYGHFLGCDNYPKCKTMMKIVEGKVDTTPVAPKKKKKAAKKAVKKKSAKESAE